MPRQTVNSKVFLFVTIGVACFFLVWNVAFSTLSGWQLYYRVVLNLAVIGSVLFGFRYAKLLVKIWAVLPLISLGIFLLTSMLRGVWSAYPIEHLLSVALTLPIFLSANKFFDTPASEI